MYVYLFIFIIYFPVIPSTDVYQTIATMKRQFKIYFDFTLHTIPSDTVNLVHCTTGCNFGEKVNVSDLEGNLENIHSKYCVGMSAPQHLRLRWRHPGVLVCQLCYWRR